MNAPARLRMSFDQYVDWESRQERKYEFVDGEVRLMAGGTVMQGVIASNIVRALGGRLRGGPCRVVGSDAKIRVPNGNARYPDAMVVCGRFKSGDLLASDPRILIEVLSPSTEWFDQTQKLEEYQSMPSVSHVAFFSQAHPFARVWTRSAEGWTSQDSDGGDASVSFSAIAADIPLSEVYEDVEFEPVAE